MNKFPYIAESSQSGAPWLIYNEALAICLGHEFHTHQKTDSYNLFEFFSKNITAEYLANTYGKIESKEHAEFIIKLAENAGFHINEEYRHRQYFFCFKGGSMYFCHFESVASDNNEKLITIPLPTSGKEVKKEEWPQVGDEVVVASRKGVVTLDADSRGVYVVDIDGEYSLPRLGEMRKPPTAEEELTDILTEITGYQNRQAVLSAAKAIINGEIEDLEYKPQ